MRKLKHIFWHSFWAEPLRLRSIKLWREKKKVLLTLKRAEAAENKAKLLQSFAEQHTCFQ